MSGGTASAPAAPTVSTLTRSARPPVAIRRATINARRESPGMHGAYQSGGEIGMIRPMAQGLRELVGRGMIDPGFLAELQRAPEPLLTPYELSDAQRATVRQALAPLAKTPSRERPHQV